jgi:hypothetical protein
MRESPHERVYSVPMGRGRLKSSKTKSLWRGAKWALGWPIALAGLGGISDSIETWTRWIDRVLKLASAAMTDPRAAYFAAKAVEIADFINQYPVRVGLFLAGAGILVWPMRWFWRFRHRLVFWGSRILDVTVWIGTDRALDLIQRSPWAHSRKRRSEKRKPFYEMYAGYSAIYGPDPEDQVRENLFYAWCKLALKKFAEQNAESVREVEKGQEYEETKLREYLAKKYESDLYNEFGSP